MTDTPDWNIDDLIKADTDSDIKFSRCFGFCWILLTCTAAVLPPETFCRMVQYHITPKATHLQRHQIMEKALPYVYDFHQRCSTNDLTNIALEDQMAGELVATLIPILDGVGVIDE